MFTILRRDTSQVIGELDEHGLLERCGLEVVHRHNGTLIRNHGAPARVILVTPDGDRHLSHTTTHPLFPDSLIDMGELLIRYHAEPNGHGPCAPPPTATHAVRANTVHLRGLYRKSGAFVPFYRQPPRY